MTKAELEWCVFMAKQNAMHLYETGKLNSVQAEEWLETEAKVRARMKRKGASWPEAKIQRKTKARLAIRKIWRIGRAVAPKPFGGVLVSVGESMERLAEQIKSELSK